MVGRCRRAHPGYVFLVALLAAASVGGAAGRARGASGPSSRGDQIVFYYDAREGRTTFLNVRNVDGRAVRVRLTAYSPAVVESSSQIVDIPGHGLRTIDVGSLRTSGLPAQVGIVVATGVNEAGDAVVTKALTGNFTVANLATGAAWGGPAVRRRARLAVAGPDGDDSASRDSVIDGTTVQLEPVEAGTANLATYYDPAKLRPAAEGGNELVVLSFVDELGAAAKVGAGVSRWTATARKNGGTPIPVQPIDADGVVVTDLVSLLGPSVNGSAGSIDLELDLAASPLEGVNRVLFFAEALGTFGTGYRLPTRPPNAPQPSPSPGASPAPGATPTPTPGLAAAAGLAAPAASPPPAQGSGVRADQVVAYYDARPGYTTFVNLRNHDDNDRHIGVFLASADLAMTASTTVDIAGNGTSTLDVAELVASKGLPRGPGLLFACRIDPAGGCVVSGRLSGNFTVANLTTGSAWGGPVALRSAYRLTGTGPIKTGDSIDGIQIGLRVIDDGDLDLAGYYDPATLAPAKDGGNQIILVAFRDGTLPIFAPAAATASWQVTRARSDGSQPIAPTALAVSGVQVTDLTALLGDGISGAAGSLLFATGGPRQDDVNRMVFFAEALGTFGTGYRLPALR